MLRMIATGLMVLAVLMLSASQIQLRASGHPQSHAAHHHVMAAQTAGQANAPCTDHCDLKGHGSACCIAACALASASLPTGFSSTTLPFDTTVAYRAAVAANISGLAPDPALRPPERVG